MAGTSSTATSANTSQSGPTDIADGSAQKSPPIEIIDTAAGHRGSG